MLEEFIPLEEVLNGAELIGKVTSDIIGRKVGVIYANPNGYYFYLQRYLSEIFINVKVEKTLSPVYGFDITHLDEFAGLKNKETFLNNIISQINGVIKKHNSNREPKKS